MRRITIVSLALLCSGVPLTQVFAQGYPMGGAGPGQMGGRGGAPHEENIPTTPSAENPDKAAAKAYSAGMKSMAKARELEDAVAKATDPGKKARDMDKLGDTYGRALDQFTEVLRNKGDMYDAWNQVGYVHLRLGAYRESVDDYNHALALKPDLPDATLHRAEAYLAVDHLDEAKTAYMDLFYHERPLADELMVSMQAWLQSHRTDAGGVRAGDIDSFDKWLHERESVAKTASTAP
jgi:tetratricopeptide (TPR) repeat protein